MSIVLHRRNLVLFNKLALGDERFNFLRLLKVNEIATVAVSGSPYI